MLAKQSGGQGGLSGGQGGSPGNGPGAGSLMGQNTGTGPAGGPGNGTDAFGDGPTPFPVSDKPTRKMARVGSQPLIMAVVLGVSTASIFAMRQVGARSGMVFADVVVEYEQEDAAKARTYERIIADLARVQTPLDVALGEFGKSPFMLDDATTVTSADGTPQAGPSAEELAVAEARKREAARREEIKGAAAALELHIVMGSLARINGQNFQLGDVVNDVFLVTAVDGRSVTLTAEGQTFVLTMAEGGNQKKKAPMPGKPQVGKKGK